MNVFKRISSCVEMKINKYFSFTKINVGLIVSPTHASTLILINTFEHLLTLAFLNLNKSVFTHIFIHLYTYSHMYTHCTHTYIHSLTYTYIRCRFCRFTGNLIKRSRNDQSACISLMPTVKRLMISLPL